MNFSSLPSRLNAVTRLVTGIALSGFVGALLGLNGCGGGSGGYGGSSSGGMNQPGYAITNLVANSAAEPANHIDANLINPWGISFGVGAPVWVANNGMSNSTLYDGNGVIQTLVVALPAGTAGANAPTGIVANATTDFKVAMASGTPWPSQFIFAGLGGTITGWSPDSNATNGIIAFDGGAAAAVFTGLAIGQDSGGHNFLYAADFGHASVDVFDATFAPVVTAGGFVDAMVPAGYAPFGIQNIPTSAGVTQIYVAYAQIDTTTHQAAIGAHLGYLAVFDAQGNLITHLVSGGALNAPWGIALAPATGFGPMSGGLLVGNFGDGWINVYDPSTGAAMGNLMQPSGLPVAIPGLWGIAFGNGTNSQSANQLFFAAGINNQAGGLYGRIDYGTATGTSSGGGY
ncbi:MAG TPA: TIGR03118 family protein [Steroidobacteraceae bacterium]